MSHTFSVSFDGTFTAGLSTSGGIDVSDMLSAVTVGVHRSWAAYIAQPVTGAGPRHSLLRVQPGIVNTMPPPAYIGGRPGSPRIFGSIGYSGTVLSGPGHMRGFPDPDPVWTGSAWDPAPPDSPAGANFIRWSARHLPDPADVGGPYLLGARTAEDDTIGLPGGAAQWNAGAGSDFDIPWSSAYPFKPTVRAHVHYGEDGTIFTPGYGVYIHPHRATHMWADMGVVLTPPFTVMIACVLLARPPRGSWNYIFDAGYDPDTAISDAQRGKIFRRGMSADIKLSEAEGYRNALRFGRHRIQTFNDDDVGATGRIGHLPLHHRLRPHVLTMVVHGADSHLMAHDSLGVSRRGFTLAGHGAQRLWVLGRRNGLLSFRRTPAMVVFEIRAWDKALTNDHIDGHYEQLSSTWKFHAYDRQIVNELRSET